MAPYYHIESDNHDYYNVKKQKKENLSFIESKSICKTGSQIMWSKMLKLVYSGVDRLLYRKISQNDNLISRKIYDQEAEKITYDGKNIKKDVY